MELKYIVHVHVRLSSPVYKVIALYNSASYM